MTDSEKLDLLIVQMQAMNGRMDGLKKREDHIHDTRKHTALLIVYHTECKADGIQGLHSFC